MKDYDECFITMYKDEDFFTFLIGNIVAVAVGFSSLMAMAYFTDSLSDPMMYFFIGVCSLYLVYQFIGYAYAKIGYIARTALLWTGIFSVLGVMFLIANSI